MSSTRTRRRSSSSKNKKNIMLAFAVAKYE
jgi:hypothetical protein